jgi:osmotically-inducible protein OsmY
MWESKGDRQLEKDVIDALVWDPSVDQTGIAVSAKDGVVSLSGAVPSYAMKLAAEQDAEHVSGVRAVVQHVNVQVPDTHLRSDADLAKAVTNALEWHVEVPERKVKLTVENGWVTLEGAVDWRYQRDAAERVVRYLTGVRGVSNEIKVASPVSSADVRQRIEAALKRSAEADARTISVTTSDGSVTLRGKIHSWAERDEALRAAWSAPGVWTVEDQLSLAS